MIKKILRYFIILLLLSSIAFAGGNDGPSHYIVNGQKISKDVWIKNHRLPYPETLDTWQPPTYETIYKSIMTDCCKKDLSHEEKMSIIRDFVEFYEKVKLNMQEMKKWEYFEHPTCKATMLRSPDGKIYNAGLIKWGMSVNVINHKYTKTRSKTLLITLPHCARINPNTK